MVLIEFSVLAVRKPLGGLEIKERGECELVFPIFYPFCGITPVPSSRSDWLCRRASCLFTGLNTILTPIYSIRLVMISPISLQLMVKPSILGCAFRTSDRRESLTISFVQSHT